MITDPEMQPHRSGAAECLDCDYSWVAVWPVGADALECPNCHGTETDREASCK